MKSYNIKYNIKQEVLILSDKKIYKSHIIKIRVTEESPYFDVNAQKQFNGITIEYMVKAADIGTCSAVFSWYKQEDIFTSEDELIKQISFNPATTY